MDDAIRIIGETKGWLLPKEYVEKSGIPIEIDDSFLCTNSSNTIAVSTKTRMRDSLWTDTGGTISYIGQNGYFTTSTSGDAEDGNDGITIFEEGEQDVYTMPTAVHPSDPTGNYYRKWRGTITFTATGTYTIIAIGVNYSTPNFTSQFANNAVSVSPSIGDVYVLDWKLSVT